MKKTILLIFVLASMLTKLLSAQTVLFHENFEAPSYGDSLITTADTLGFPTTSFKPWATSTNLFNSGMRCDSNTLQPLKTIYLTSLPFSTVGANNVSLQFSHICKLFFADGGYVEVSNDNGITWYTLTITQYQDSGIMIQNRFCENAYNQWLPGDTITKPTNSWWKTEHFDISSLTLNSPNVKIRFRYFTTGATGSAGRYGWLIDDVKVYKTSASQYTVSTNGFPF